MGESSLGLTKFFVSNIPDCCSSVDVGEFFSVFGNVARVYVARKRDKNGNNFCFVTFKGVKDVKDLEGRLRGVKMGDFKLQVNLAKFAAENPRTSEPLSGGAAHQNRPARVGRMESNLFNFRDGRSYSDVLGKVKGKGGVSLASEGVSDVRLSDTVRSIVVPDRISAFKGLAGLAVIGRTVNLETLVDFDKLLRIAKVDFARIQYLGGLSILISFSDGAAANSFLEACNIWGPWFTKLEAWTGQTLPLERVAWLKLLGIPLNLLEAEVFMQVGELFGNVLFVPKVIDEDQDLSVIKIGVLVGEARRCSESVSLKWKDRVFRIWVDEDNEDWVPDCLDYEDTGIPESDSSLASSPVAGEVYSVEEEDGGTRKMDGLEECRKSPLIDGVQSEGLSPMPVHAENSGYIPVNEAAAGPPISGTNVNIPSASVGPSVFACGNGPSPLGPDLVDGTMKSRARRKPFLGSKQWKEWSAE
ncbi:putative RNA recognition motif domain, nucleotide-binding alpha-beta plait domain superfamily [Helianthus annuus]|uniref:RNA recognition motif domain, nucleotide-binding alpha-beta plait domain superfamily n=1 Tax=Helianthus annuus TaxID=4232 RepID=A0A9K3MWQ4_HELAN|nr:putative RNA recognition motif domain, nucleotide-binding alpha-beta plait domain superfamily [Helianthus annuus]KAJ0494165.1 putative RNA recognition motif domain, nucleotide-binding alpha-beta plait domain superfamily [Helianthus annuus]KAJ0505988.1 putative RNA recognition motif domain, nucleotide-binding alpha-beta plait domain superfamily [Helianthus annuus]KAJ0678936.1 putative RNA recognition motif domain, nucleotide-binding alpha-beta plait domain superfamily [Helianthus annuus]KAJ08